MSRITIDWNAIRPFNGGRDKGFEELCTQLARAESPIGSRFVRKGTPDAGVECYTIFQDNSEWAWQSKYIDSLGDSQWSQIDESVRTALDKHPQLVQYFVCIPFDLPDGRIKERMSAKERWDEHVKKWRRWAFDRKMTVEFVYWGSHELLERLTKLQHVGRVRFWFDALGFDDAWFSARLDEALKTAGPRYTPEIHVDLPIAEEFDAFGRTEWFFNRVKMLARNIREKFLSFDPYNVASVGDEVLATAIASLKVGVEAVLSGLAAIQTLVIGPLPFVEIKDLVITAEEISKEVEHLLFELEQKHDARAAIEVISTSKSTNGRNQFHDRIINLSNLSAEFRKVREILTHADNAAGCRLLLLRGANGTGKTHLLCDVAKQRIAAGQPTILLMGQRFISSDTPWTQVLQQLDLPGSSAEEFVGALEAASQAAGCRALLLIDAINEGSGRTLWSNHLAAFLAQIDRSPWIGVVLSIRSSFEEIVIPEEVRSSAWVVTHEGFAEHEYDATRTFFVYYGLELPSTPLLAPEFRNPLFLKTLCRGLSAKGERRLPRGFQGITAVFELYLAAINERLATVLGFNRKAPLVRQALDAFSEAMSDSGSRWLPLSKGEEVVNALLPGRDFERSLYRGLVAEDMLIEEAAWRENVGREEVVFVSYERFADHLIAKTLLDKHLDFEKPELAFLPNGPLSYLTNEKQFVSPGLLEALCIQIPERTGEEFTTLAPTLLEDRWGIGNAFLQSLVWRKFTAFSDGTRETMNKLSENIQGLHETLDVLLTVATLPDHPLNAIFLNKRLRADSMPDRDAWWSMYLHDTWRNHGAVDRIVDWASSVTPSMILDNEAVDLCATTLAWMFTTSNRFLRDHATKALTTLLTGRIAAVGQLVERFADVDDPYVLERVYAVAYGVSSRCYDSHEVGTLAEQVYSRVFATGTPAPHILLRDYARGVIERALYLGCNIQIITANIRPPYNSQWPEISTEEDIKPLLPDWSKGSHDSGDLEWARNRIGSSVMSDDFARYVIGTNSSSRSHNWLSLSLKASLWEAPEPPEKQLDAFVTELSDEEREAWVVFNLAEREFKKVLPTLILHYYEELDAEIEGDNESRNHEDIDKEHQRPQPPEIVELESKRDQALDTLYAVLSNERIEKLERIFAAQNASYDSRRPPEFELGQIQRYILWRVFNLGWTTERFGEFDRFSIGYRGRDASKAERIGKKYQWIAYHEIQALIADHFQYREEFQEYDHTHLYDGPWQVGLRDIDPSSTIRATLGETSISGHSLSWWDVTPYSNWGKPENPREWVLSYTDIPEITNLLLATHPEDGSRWVNAQCFFNWMPQPPADKESTDVERRELWLICTGYLIRSTDALAFVNWAEGVDFWGRWMPDPPTFHEIFLGEYGWSSASRYFQQQYFGDDGWTQPDNGCPAKVRTIAVEYSSESNGFDCSVDEGFTLRLPTIELVSGMGLRWIGNGADFVTAKGQLGAFDPAVHMNGPSALLLQEDLLREFLVKENLTICWTVIGEKQVLSPGFNFDNRLPNLRVSGAYILGQRGVVGFQKYTLDDPDAEDDATERKILALIRSSSNHDFDR